MVVGGLAVPELLVKLVASGDWPANQEQARPQNLEPVVDEARVQAIAPEETRLFLYPPPVNTVAGLIDRGDTFWSEAYAAVTGLDPAKAVVIGHFGIGSDAPIALDYRASPDRPVVLRLC